MLKLGKVPFSPRLHILNCLVTYSLKTDCNVQKFYECHTVQHCQIFKFCSPKQETDNVGPIGICNEGDGLVALIFQLKEFSALFSYF